jgi:hypothetical protein
VLSGLFLFLCFAKLEDIPRLRKVIHFLAPGSLGVYLIHVHPIIWSSLVKGFSKSFTHYNSIIMILLALGASVVLYLVCTLIDLLRIKIFQIFKVKHLCTRLDNYIVSKLGAEKESANP